MSHYPPGVTGREPEIAGYPERTERVECEATGMVHFRHELLDYPTIADALNEAHSREIDCEWEGEVEGWVVGYDFEWTCPRCGTQHVEDGWFEPDPDEWRD